MELTLHQQEELVHNLASTADALEYGCVKAEILETHISWVLLTKHHAFKIKKALDLGFLDYSSLTLRFHYCREELRLNGRTAPRLYLDVVAFGGRPDSPCVGDEPVIEYAVRMRRFPQKALLDHWALEDRLQPTDIDRVAEVIACFHAKIPAASSDTPFGDPETLYRPVSENFEALHRASEKTPGPFRIDEQEAWVAAEFNRLRSTFTRRKRDGFIRECHGDLHLGNLAEVNGEIVLFDCIEFNPVLRWIDIISELAFLLMDLEHRGKPYQAARLLDRYLQLTGDYSGVEVLRFYKHYRAMVRAKVTLIRLSQADLEHTERLPLIEDFGAYLTLAGSYTRAPNPFLILTYGPSGCGKTYVTDELLQPLDAIRVRSDVERKRLFGLRADESSRSGLKAGIYSREASERTYAHLKKLARHILAAGYSCIVDATFLRRDQRAPFLSLADERDVPVRILEFRTDRSVLEKRVTERAEAGRDASEADLAVLAGQLESIEPLSDEEREKCITVDSDEPVSGDALAKRVLR